MWNGRQQEEVGARVRRGAGPHPRWKWRVAAALVASLTGSSPATAENAATAKGWQEHVTLTLSDRARGEFVDWFEPSAGKAAAGAHRYDFFANQLRVGAKVNVPHVLFTVEAQDTRLVNLPDDASAVRPDASPDAKTVKAGGNLGPGALYFFHTRSREQGETFLKQGHLTLTDLPGLSGVSATVGRFEYSDGLETTPTDPALAWLKKARIGERLVGPFGYTHVTRSFDGGKLVYDSPDVNATAWGSRPTQGGFEVSANPELDIWLAGLALTLKQLADLPPLDARVFYVYYEDDRTPAVSASFKVDNRPDAARKTDRKDLAIHTWGAHALSLVDAGPGKVDGLLWATVQSGKWGQLNHLGWAYALETGYQLPKVFAAPWLRVGYNRSSGDDDSNDNHHETFFQLIPTVRIYAQFPFYNLMNNEDLFAQLILKPHAKVTVRGDYHWLRLTEIADRWYAGGGATNDQVFGFAGIASGGQRELAHVADVAISVAILKQLSAYIYYGRAFGQGVVKSTFAGSDANYGYLEMTYRY